MDFDLRQHIRTVLAETADENLDVLTALVFERTPRQAVRDAYRQALAEVVRKELATAPRLPDPRLDQVHRDTHSSLIEPGQNSVTGEGQKPSETQSGTTLPGGGQNHRTSRTALFRRFGFRESVCVGDKTYRRLLECTAENLAFAAAESERQSDANAAAARRYRRLLKLMAERHAKTVAELTDDEVREAMTDE